MSDDLQPRIEDILGDCRDKYGVDDYRLMAEAVIRELDSHGWLIDPESADRKWQNEKARWLKGEDDE